MRRALTTTWDYDVYDRKIAEIDPLGATTSFSYDSDNRLTSMTNRNNGQRNFGDDEEGRLVQETWYGGITEKNDLNYSYLPASTTARPRCVLVPDRPPGLDSRCDR